MLVDFTVENYRSIKEPVTLSAVAQRSRQGSQSSKNKRTKTDNEITPGYQVEGWDIEILPVLAIFGANASGKSNVIQALDYLLLLMAHGSQELAGTSRLFKYAKPTPFRLDGTSSKEPTRFELRTLFNNNIYTYSLAINQNLIISESLEYKLAETKRSRILFQRIWNEESKKNKWKNGSDFSGSHIQLQKSVRDNESFISILLKLEVTVVEPLCMWLRNRWPGISLGNESYDLFNTVTLYNATISTSLQFHKKALKIIKKFDTGLSGIQIQKKEDENFEFDIYALHKTNEGNEIRWSFEEESLGTQRLLSLAYRMILVFYTGDLILIDELGNNIHPNIVRSIVRMFQNPKMNPKHGQLILTSHDNTLQRNNLLRRDQLWFTQKRSDQSTELYPLTDFHVRNDLAIDKAYLDGRFGAVPFLPSDEEMILQGEEKCQES
ncbi:hypothetical protein BCD67_19550 [Oscillatoriales cyanobacterium USR001]|nr:hypothetical protein BCD67_19550 [Oscillatoriales cyanobacterium USR001]